MDRFRYDYKAIRRAPEGPPRTTSTGMLGRRLETASRFRVLETFSTSNPNVILDVCSHNREVFFGIRRMKHVNGRYRLLVAVWCLRLGAPHQQAQACSR